MGYATFSILFAVLDIGFVIVRVVGLTVCSGSLALVVVISMSPSFILQMAAYRARLLKRKKRESGGEVDTEARAVVDGTRN